MSLKIKINQPTQENKKYLDNSGVGKVFLCKWKPTGETFIRINGYTECLNFFPKNVEVFNSISYDLVRDLSDLTNKSANIITILEDITDKVTITFDIKD